MLTHDIYPKIDLNTYQKEAVLKDGTKILLRPMVPGDQEALYEFFKAFPKKRPGICVMMLKADFLLNHGQKTLITARPCPFWL